MTYLDTSVLLAHLLDEERQPPAALWEGPVVSSRLAEYEVWTCVHREGLGASHGDVTRALLGRLAFVELTPTILARALEPFPHPVRTLDALHLASIEFLRSKHQPVRLATYDDRQRVAAVHLGIDLFPLLPASGGAAQRHRAPRRSRPRRHRP